MVQVHQSRRNKSCYTGSVIRRTGAPLRVLVATDGSRAGQAAVHFAAKLAGRDPGTCLEVVAVDVNGGLEAASRSLRRSRIPAAVRRFSARPREPIPDAIVREADRWKADLIVVGSEGRDTLREWVVSGVALRLIYLARRPVAVVRPPRSRKRGSPA
jgi:nucleotide-binding universal stress UspA family protein